MYRSPSETTSIIVLAARRRPEREKKRFHLRENHTGGTSMVSGIIME